MNVTFSPSSSLLCITMKMLTHGENKLKHLPSIQHYYTVIGKPWASFAYYQKHLITSLEWSPFELIYSPN